MPDDSFHKYLQIEVKSARGSETDRDRQAEVYRISRGTRVLSTAWFIELWSLSVPTSLPNLIISSHRANALQMLKLKHSMCNITITYPKGPKCTLK